MLGFAAPAPGWEEPELERIMAHAAKLQEKVQTGLESGRNPAAAEAAMNLAAVFDDVHDFWERKGMESAEERAGDVAVRARAVAALIERGDFKGAAQAANNMNGNCQGCHVASGVPAPK
jgi:hypothetical protein